MQKSVAALALALASPAAAAGAAAEPPSAAIAAAQRIATPEGVEALEQVDVGDGKQWISIRGRNRANPVLLVIHGGPGTPTMPVSWAWQSPWEDFFTVVNWDQRGVGRNAAGADRAQLVATTSLDRIVMDGEAVVDHLRRRLGKDKVAVLGFSWGSIVGVKLAQKVPGKISVYSAVGQAVGTAYEPVLIAEAKAAAQAAGDAEGVAALAAIDPRPGPDGRFPIRQAQAARRVAMRYDGMWYGHDSLAAMNDMAALSPDYGLADVEAFRTGASWLSESAVARDLQTTDLRTVTRLEVPVVVLQGRYDLATVHKAAEAWVGALSAPSKQFITFERSSHFVMLEEPGRFLQALMTHVLPAAGGSPDFAMLPRRPRKQP
jgi:pimeloyl-ACP methyl ester carboxylesterase